MSQHETPPGNGRPMRPPASPQESPQASPKPPPALTPERALALWHGVMVQALRAAHPDLTARQFALMIHVYQTPPPHTVRGLAAALKISKPAVTRALDRLGAYEFLRRRRDEADKRSVLVQRTLKGAAFLRAFAELTAKVAREV